MTLTKHMKVILTALLVEARRLEAIPEEFAQDSDRDFRSALRREHREYQEHGIRHDLAYWLGHPPTPAESAVYSRALRNMETLGLLVRVNRWGGRRATHVRLTPRGRAEAEHLTEAQEAALDSLMSGLSFHLEEDGTTAGHSSNPAEDGLDSVAPPR